MIYQSYTCEQALPFIHPRSLFYSHTATSYDVSRFSPNLSTFVKTFSSIHASILRNTSSVALSLMRRWVASRSSTINLLSALLVSFRCLINCLAGGSHVSKYPADGRSDLADVPEETEAPLALPPAVDFPALGDLDRAFTLGMTAVVLVFESRCRCNDQPTRWDFLARNKDEFSTMEASGG